MEEFRSNSLLFAGINSHSLFLGNLVRQNSTASAIVCVAHTEALQTLLQTPICILHQKPVLNLGIDIRDRLEWAS